MILHILCVMESCRKKKLALRQVRFFASAEAHSAITKNQNQNLKWKSNPSVAQHRRQVATVRRCKIMEYNYGPGLGLGFELELGCVCLCEMQIDAARENDSHGKKQFISINRTF